MKMKKVRVEFPLGEVQGLGMLISMGIIPKPEIDPRGLTGKEKWNAQGLEGKAYVIVDSAMAAALVFKLGKFRSRIVKA